MKHEVIEARPLAERAISILLSLALILTSAAWSLKLLPGVDFAVFWSAANADFGDLYRTEIFINPPSALIWISPLQFVPIEAGFAVWVIASVVAFAVTSPFPKWATAAALISPIAVTGIIVGQMSLLLTAAIFVAVRYRSGFLLGVVLTIKPQLAFLAPLIFLFRGDWRFVAEMIVGAALSIAVELIVYGPLIWLDWLSALPVWRGFLIKYETLAYAASPAAYAEGFGIPSLPVWVVSAALAVGVALKWSRKLDGGPLVALILCSSALAAPYSLLYDLVGAAPLAVLIAYRRASVSSVPVIVGLTGYFTPLALLAGAIFALFSRTPWHHKSA